MMMTQTNNSGVCVWDDAEVLTNMVLEVWGDGDDLKCDILLTDENPTNLCFRFQRFHYQPGAKEITLVSGLGAMVE